MTKRGKHRNNPVSKMVMISVLRFLGHEDFGKLVNCDKSLAVSAYLLLQFFEEPIDLLVNIFDTLLDPALWLFRRL